MKKIVISPRKLHERVQLKNLGMKVTEKEASRNMRKVEIQEIPGKEQWSVSCIFRGKRRHSVFYDRLQIENFRSGDAKRIHTGYQTIVNYISRTYELPFQ